MDVYIEYIGPKKEKTYVSDRRRVVFRKSARFGNRKIVKVTSEALADEMLQYTRVFQEVSLDDILQVEAEVTAEAEKALNIGCGNHLKVNGSPVEPGKEGESGKKKK